MLGSLAYVFLISTKVISKITVTHISTILRLIFVDFDNPAQRKRCEFSKSYARAAMTTIHLNSGGSWYFSLGGQGFKKLGVVENTFGSHTQKTLPPDSKIHFFNKKQIIWLQPGCFSIFFQIQSEIFLTFIDFQW